MDKKQYKEMKKKISLLSNQHNGDDASQNSEQGIS